MENTISIQREKLGESHSKFMRNWHKTHEHPLLNKHHSKETRRKMSESHKGEKHHFWGKNHSKKHKEKISKTRKERLHLYPNLFENGNLYGCKNKGNKRPDLSEKNKDPKFIKKRLQGLIQKPNKPEKIMIQLISQNIPNTFQYTGDGKIIIDSFCPDFVYSPAKKIIEIYGEYHHNLPEVIKRDKRRLKAYKKHGFDTLIIWSKELKDLNKVLGKVEVFLCQKML